MVSLVFILCYLTSWLVMDILFSLFFAPHEMDIPDIWMTYKISLWSFLVILDGLLFFVFILLPVTFISYHYILILCYLLGILMSLFLVTSLLPVIFMYLDDLSFLVFYNWCLWRFSLDVVPRVLFIFHRGTSCLYMAFHPSHASPILLFGISSWGVSTGWKGRKGKGVRREEEKEMSQKSFIFQSLPFPLLIFPFHACAARNLLLIRDKERTCLE